MKTRRTHLNEDERLIVNLPNGEAIEIQFDGSDPIVVMIAFDGTRIPSVLHMDLEA